MTVTPYKVSFVDQRRIQIVTPFTQVVLGTLRTSVYLFLTKYRCKFFIEGTRSPMNRLVPLVVWKIYFKHLD